MSTFDPIFAPITGLGRAAVAVVRLSGPGAWALASQIFQPWEPESHRAVYGRLSTGDDGLALPFAAGRGYTGEEAVEFSIHGSPASMRLLLEALARVGARPAEPGEFTLRAFMNGRLDLSQAEAVRDLVESETELAFQAAAQQREGSLRQFVSGVRDRLFGVVAAIEASVDFSEEIGEFDRDLGGREVAACLRALGDLQHQAQRAQILRQGLRVALVGRPNAGKSSLMNALLGSERAIVTPIAGTTRDFIEERVDLTGLPVVLIDTAGLRETTDPIELAGIRRTYEVASSADEIWYLFDASEGWTHEDEEALGSLGRARVLANKSDLRSSDRGFGISAATGLGLSELVQRIKVERDLAEPPTFLLTERHLPSLEEASECLLLALEGLGDGAPDDVLVSALRLAIRALGEITGETASEDMIQRVFRDFCIGK